MNIKRVNAFIFLLLRALRAKKKKPRTITSFILDSDSVAIKNASVLNHSFI